MATRLAEPPDTVPQWHRANAAVGSGPAGFVYQVQARAAPNRSGGGCGGVCITPNRDARTAAAAAGPASHRVGLSGVAAAADASDGVAGDCRGRGSRTVTPHRH